MGVGGILVIENRSLNGVKHGLTFGRENIISILSYRENILETIRNTKIYFVERLA